MGGTKHDVVGAFLARTFGLEDTVMATQQTSTSAAREMALACDGARRAMFAAASRVISYHQAALDAKVSRMVSSESQRPSFDRTPADRRS